MRGYFDYYSYRCGKSVNYDKDRCFGYFNSRYLITSSYDLKNDVYYSDLSKYVPEERIVYDSGLCKGKRWRTRYDKLKEVLEAGCTLFICDVCCLGEELEEVRDELKYFYQNKIQVVLLLDDDMYDTTASFEFVIHLLVTAEMFAKRRIDSHRREGYAAMSLDEFGHKVSARTGRRVGRPSLEYPENWDNVMAELEKGNLTTSEAIERLGMKRSSFFKLQKLYYEG